MIQRIQTVYLLTTAVLTSLVIAFPLMDLITTESVFHKVNAIGVYFENSIVYSLFPILLLLILSILLSLGIVFLYKKRKLQIRLCLFNILLMIGFYVLFAGYYQILQKRFSAELFLKWPVILPAINIVFLYLAVRAIKRDEALVRAADRLR